MADYSIAAVTRRAVYTGSAGTGPYAFSFALLATSDIAVYKDTTLLTETSDYTVTLSATTGTGSITLAVAANSGHTITLIGSRALARTTDFVTAGSLTASALNVDFDSLVIFSQQLAEENSRNLKAPVTEGISGTTDMTIPPKATRASKILEFDSNGNPTVSITATSLSTIAGITGNITTVAGIAANVTTVAGISANVTTVAGIASNVTSVAAVSSLITSDFVSDLNTLATSAIITDLDILASADIVADLALLATSDVVSDLNTLATSDIVTDINVLATTDIVADLAILATSDIVADLAILATSDIVSDLNTLATSDIVTDLNILGTSANVTNMATLGASGVVSNIATVSGSIANVNTTASNIAGVNSFAARYRITGGDPGSDNDAGDLNFNTSSNALKYYNGSAWVAIENYVHPNHSGEVTSTADGATVIADNIVDEANLKISNAPVNGYSLTAQSGNTGGLTWALPPAGATGGSTDQVFYENSRVMTANYTITSSKSASTVGPLTINSGVTLTIPSGERLVIL